MGGRSRRQDRSRHLGRLPHHRIGEDPIGDNDLARGKPHNLAREIGGCHLGDGEIAGRNVERGNSIGVARPACTALGDGSEEIAGARLEQAVLGQRASGDETDHVAPDDRLRAALLGFRGILHLLAHSDAEAALDQTLQIVVGRMHRDPAHGDILALVLAALRELDAERLARRHRVVEEEFVEVAHAIEEQAVGIGGLDLGVLRHHRRQRGGRRRRLHDFGRRLGRRRRLALPIRRSVRSPARLARPARHLPRLPSPGAASHSRKS